METAVSNKGHRKIRVLVVDDSAVVRESLKLILESDPEIEVMDTAMDPFHAARKLESEVPDVITLDVEMPRMDGITFLHKIMSQHPIPVVMCSSLTREGCETTLRALEYGAVDIINKPRIGASRFLEDSRISIIDSIKAASNARVKKIPARRVAPQKKLTADAVVSPKPAERIRQTTGKVVVIGASTGGTEALRVYLEAMPLDCPPIAIVQHMPQNFTMAFANRLDTICSIEVKEAQDGDGLLKGRALIAPGNKHMVIRRSGVHYFVDIADGPLVCRHRPSVDVLFRSASQNAGRNAVGVLMTGMGDDGARGLLEMRNSGAYTIAQDENSCVVFGMPQEAIRLNAVEAILPLELIAPTVIDVCNL